MGKEGPVLDFGEGPGTAGDVPDSHLFLVRAGESADDAFLLGEENLRLERIYDANFPRATHAQSKIDVAGKRC